MIKAILWDNDGILVDTEGLFFRSNREIMAEYGVEVSVELFAEWSLRRGRSLIDLLDDHGPEEREAIRERRNQHYAELIREGVRVFDAIDEVLDALYGRVPMAVVTSSNASHFDQIHAQTGLLRYFEFVLKGGDYTHHKPHPEPYLEAATRLGVSPAECLVVEDSERGLESACRAGMRCVVIPNALTPRSRFESAYVCLDSARELLGVVEPLIGE